MYSAHHELGLPVVGPRSCAATLVSCSHICVFGFSVPLWQNSVFVWQYGRWCSQRLPLARGHYPPKSEILIHRDFSVQRHSKLFKAVQSHSRIFRNIFLFLCPHLKNPPSATPTTLPTEWNLELLPSDPHATGQGLPRRRSKQIAHSSKKILLPKNAKPQFHIRFIF